MTKSSFSSSVTSDEAATLTVGGKLTYVVKKNGKRVKKSIKLTTMSQSLAAGATTKITFKLSSKARTALRKAKSLKASLTFTAADAAGNKSTSTSTLTIKAKP